MAGRVEMVWVLAVLVASCSPTPAVVPTADAAASASAASASVSASAGLAPALETNVTMQLAAYRVAFVAALADKLGATKVAELSKARLDPLGHEVLTFASSADGRGPFRFVTVGFGRRAQPHASGSTPPFVELVAEADDNGWQIAAALSLIGRWMHSASRPLEARFKAFDTLRLEKAAFGMRFFVLVPAAGAELPDGHRVTLLRVIPMGEQDYTFLKMRGEGAVRAWWHRHRTDALLATWWTPALSQSE